MTSFELVFVLLYFAILFFLSLYGAHRYQMAMLYWRHRNHLPAAPPVVVPPKVTIQLPIFNERYVVERLIEHVCRIRYPSHRLQIQILDDSTDETASISKRLAEQWRQKGLDVEHVRRTDRVGFKAGALEAGLKSATGELIAVFDADFLPTQDFLERAVPYFGASDVGMVQARWEHINRDYSWLTQAQSVLLDGHFVIEHTARNRSGRFFNFNGTAGIWRRSCIEASGGWQHDTLTEDLDLSYRAQLAGWRFIFLNDLLVPSEIPVDINAFRTQQHRWAKGSIQVAKKMLPKILKSNLSAKIKAEAFIHLTSNLAYIMMVALAVMMPFSIHIRHGHGWREALLVDIPFFISATVSVCFFYILSQTETSQKRSKNLFYIPFVLSLGIGLCVNNARAALEAIVGHQSDFIRTPKHAIENRNQRWIKKLYKGQRDFLPLLEIGLSVHYTYAIIYCLENQIYASIPLLLLFQMGFIYTGLMSLFQPSFAAIKRVLAD